LNAQFAIPEQLSFREDYSGLIVAEISNPQATASLCLQGAHLMAWQPRAKAVPVLWLSRDAKLAAASRYAAAYRYAGRGSARMLPSPAFRPRLRAHGSPQVVESGTEPDGATRLTLRPVGKRKDAAQWPIPARSI
jgi:dihydroxy-acid dehydratase/glucose-6-phosphate 1-epimerase